MLLLMLSLDDDEEEEEHRRSSQEYVSHSKIASSSTISKEDSVSTHLISSKCLFDVLNLEL